MAGIPTSLPDGYVQQKQQDLVGEKMSQVGSTMDQVNAYSDYLEKMLSATASNDALGQQIQQLGQKMGATGREVEPDQGAYGNAMDALTKAQNTNVGAAPLTPPAPAGGPGSAAPFPEAPSPSQPASAPSTSIGASGDDLRAYARQQATTAGIDPDIFESQIQQESGFNPSVASPAGAQGIAQFMPGTARGMGVDPMDPRAALAGAAQLMRQHLDNYGGDYSKALAAYNAGPGAVQQYGGVPPFPETQNYVSSIQDAAQRLKASDSASRGLSGDAGASDPGVKSALGDLGSTKFQDDDGHSLCEQAVETWTGYQPKDANGNLPASAMASWQLQAGQQHGPNEAMPVGARVYFSDPNTPYGHTGLYVGNGQFVSRDNAGVEQWRVNDWQKATGQQLLGWLPPVGGAAAANPHGPDFQHLEQPAAQPQPESRFDLSGQSNPFAPEVVAQPPQDAGQDNSPSPLEGLAQGAGNFLQGEKEFTKPATDWLQAHGALDVPVAGGVLRGLVEDPVGNAARVASDAGGALLTATGVAAPAGIALAAGGNALVSGLEGAGEAENAGQAGSDVAKSAGINAVLGGAMSLAGAGLGSLASKAVGEAAKEATSAVVNSAGEAVGEGTLAMAAGSVASALADMPPPMAGGAGTGISSTADALLMSMRSAVKAIPNGTAPEAAVGVISAGGGGNAILAHGLGDEFASAMKAAGIARDDSAIVDAIEQPGQWSQLPGPIQKLAANTMDALNTGWQAGHAAGLGSDMLDNYFARIVRDMPGADQLKQIALGNRSLNSFSNFMQGRARDEAGNLRFPTIHDLQDYLDQVKPGAQVVPDVPTVIEAHTASILNAAQRAEYIDFLNRAKAGDGLPALSAFAQPGYERMDNPGLSQWVYRGNTPDDGAVLINRKGVIDGASPANPAVVSAPGVANKQGGVPVMEKMESFYVHPEFAPSIKAYLTTTLGQGLDGPIANAYHGLNRLGVQLKLFNLNVHGINMLTELMKQHALGAAAGGAVGFEGDQAANPDGSAGERIGATLGGAALGAVGLSAKNLIKADGIIRDPVAFQQLARDSGLNFATARRYAGELRDATGTIAPEAGPIQRAWNATAGKFLDLNHRALFETLGQRMQIASYLDATDRGAASDVASAYANNKFGQVRAEEFGQVARWIQQNALFAGNWTMTRARQWGAVVGAPGIGGATSQARQFGLDSAANGQLANMLRRDVMGGTGLLLGTTAMLNHGISGKWPWENDPGRYLDINTGQKDKNGNTVYYTNPFFRGEQDLLHLLTSPVTKVEQLAGVPTKDQAEYGAGTNTLQTIGNKLPPIASAARNVITNEQFAGGPPIVQKGDSAPEGFAQALAFAANQLTPSNITAQRQTHDANGKKLTTPGPLQVQGPVGPPIVEGQGVEPDQGSVRESPQSGALATIAGVRASAGARFTGDDQEKKAQQKALLEQGGPPKYYGVTPGSDQEQQIDQAIAAYQAWRRDPRGVAQPDGSTLALARKYNGHTSPAWQRFTKNERTAQDQAGTFVVPASS